MRIDLLVPLLLAAATAATFPPSERYVGVIHHDAPASVLAALQRAADDVNADPSVLAGVNFALHVNETDGTVRAAESIVKEQHERGAVGFVDLATPAESVAISYQASSLWSSVVSLAAAELTRTGFVPLERTLRLQPTVTSQAPAAASLVGLLGWRHVAVVYGHAEAEDAAHHQLEEHLAEFGGLVVAVPVPEDAHGEGGGHQVDHEEAGGGAEDEGDEAETADGLVRALLDTEYRVVFLLARDQDLVEHVAESAGRAGLAGRGRVLVFGPDFEVPSPAGGAAALLDGALRVTSVPPDKENPRFAALRNLSGLASPEDLGAEEARAYDAVWAFALAANALLAVATDEDGYTGDALFGALKNSSFDGASGAVRFDAGGDLLADYWLGSFDPESRRFVPVALFRAQGETSSWLGGAERNLRWHGGRRGPAGAPPSFPPRRVAGPEVATVAFCAVLVALALAASAAGHVWVHLRRANEIVKASSVPFCHMILAGCSVCAVAAGVEALAPRSEAWPCWAVPWLMSVGYDLVFGSLFAKTYRIACIFDQRMIRVVHLPTSKLALLVGAMVALDSAVTGGLSAHSAPAAALEPDESSPLTDVYLCRDSRPLVLALFLPKLAFQLWGVRLAYRVRNAPCNFSEAGSISLASLVTLFFACVALPVLLLIHKKSIDSALVVLVGSACIASASVAAVLFVPKVLAVRDRKGQAGPVNSEKLQTVVAGSGQAASGSGVASPVHSARASSMRTKTLQISVALGSVRSAANTNNKAELFEPVPETPVSP